VNSCIEAILNEPVEVKATMHGRKKVEVERVWVDFWDGWNWIIDAKGERVYRKTGYPEVMAFPLFDYDSVAYWHVMGEWHGMDEPNWPEYLDELGAYVPGNYGDLEVVEYE
jgi:hypothetical protein